MSFLIGREPGWTRKGGTLPADGPTELVLLLESTSIVPRIRISKFLLVMLDSDKNRLSARHGLYMMTNYPSSSFSISS